jgi:GT2 family glycosyltransferase
MRLGIVIPVYIQQQALLDLTCQATAALQTISDATLYIVCTRLHITSPEELRECLQRQASFPVRVLHERCVERSVAGAWNHGVVHAFRNGADMVAVTANDVIVEAGCLDCLIDFGKAPENRGVAVWSGINTRDRANVDSSLVTDGCDFACFMLRRGTIERHGWFDSEYKPAYCEDNDYYTRVVLGGEECSVVHAARFFHHGSMTIRLDPEAARHVRLCFTKNQLRYQTKWGAATMPNTKKEVFERCFRHPYNDPTRSLSWWPNQQIPTL